MLTVRPIGYVKSPYKRREESPPQGRFSGKLSEIEIFREYEEGLKDIDLFSHLIVLYWAHESSELKLQVLTPHDKASHGVFATRSPSRPNPICLCVVELVERRGCTLLVRGLDAVDGSPVIDIKPYIPVFDCFPEASMGWLRSLKTRR
ncbi:MAG: tRNA (N6-threonylcarbamoyladenosine(37)-N6)-methyltransferase TrmO [Thermoprotei archaeon]|nr:MAG: tRNA (N6-threonylcarbamoyladenosine(37)-N6)-methyltransferase TrmO [Thermoprotei archaeon]RLF23022.1 MAG: tRNA (N6-threonylcarbamoyladenosine(37)-N6)-methyltransferase TrmO [Thermoprotei archaeon]